MLVVARDVRIVPVIVLQFVIAVTRLLEIEGESAELISRYECETKMSLDSIGPAPSTRNIGILRILNGIAVAVAELPAVIVQEPSELEAI